MRIFRSVDVEHGVAALVTVLAHLLLIYVLVGHRGAREAQSGDASPAMLAVLIDDPYQLPQVEQPIEANPQLLTPKVHWVRPAPEFQIDAVADEPAITATDFHLPLASSVAAEQQPVEATDLQFTPAAHTRAGGVGVTVLQRVVPMYPRLSVRLLEEGTTVVRVTVNDSGRVSDVHVLRTSGFRRLDESALHALRQWRFAPATNGPHTAPQSGEVSLRFGLYRYSLSQIEAAPIDPVSDEPVRGGERRTPTAGGAAALRQFIEKLLAEDPGGATACQNCSARFEKARFKAELFKWGGVKSIAFRGGAGDDGWHTYEVKPEYRGAAGNSKVEVRWDLYEVEQEHATSQWRIAVGRDATIWSAQATAAPWQGAGG